jgi:hypothetical protein
MLQYDLSETKLARSDDGPGRVPTEGELLAVMVGLMVVEDCAYWELSEQALLLTEENREAVAECIERHLGPLARDIGNGVQLRARLQQLAGIRITGGSVDPLRTFPT